MSETVQLRFASQADADRYHRLRAQDPALHDAMTKGARAARTSIVPTIARGCLGSTREEIDPRILEFVRAGIMDLQTDLGREPTGDELFMFMHGFCGPAYDARDEHLRAHAAVEKLGEAYAHALAGVAACNEGLRLLGEVKSPTVLAQPQPSSVVPRRRPLRPEDFGALPQGPGSAGSYRAHRR